MAAAAARRAGPLTTREVLRYATINGAKHPRLDKKTGSLTPGKEADIIILDATALNVVPLNQVPRQVSSVAPLRRESKAPTCATIALTRES